jgi:DNA-binding NarL/FixJ family response regulator
VIVPKESLENKTKKAELELQLSPREIEIAQLIIEGLKNKDIAEQLNIAYETVKTHRKNIFRKLQINHVSQLIHLDL